MRYKSPWPGIQRFFNPGIQSVTTRYFSFFTSASRVAPVSGGENIALGSSYKTSKYRHKMLNFPILFIE